MAVAGLRASLLASSVKPCNRGQLCTALSIQTFLPVFSPCLAIRQHFVETNNGCMDPSSKQATVNEQPLVILLSHW